MFLSHTLEYTESIKTVEEKQTLKKNPKKVYQKYLVQQPKHIFSAKESYTLFSAFLIVILKFMNVDFIKHEHSLTKCKMLTKEYCTLKMGN